MEALKTITIAILCLPLLGAGIAGCFGKLIGKRVTHSVVILLLGIATVLSFYVLQGFVTNQLMSMDVALYTWGQIGEHTLKIGLLIDKLSALMLALVCIIALVVHVYSVYYMRKDQGCQRFFSYISLFTFAMLVLVSANNFVQLFFAWELVGVVSYLLIGFWFAEENAVKAGFKAFLINRVSDFGFLLAIVTIFACYNSLNYNEIFLQIYKLTATPPAAHIIAVLLLIAAMGKSAQVPLHVWLPDSMTGPLPVSALIHAATMVTAGIFMIVRVFPLFECSAVTLDFMLLIGAITCVAMGLVAVVQYDIKQVLAYSTISQLGLMMAALGTSACMAGMFHLIMHAFFKALLFLGAGAIIMALNNEQDLRKMGGLRTQLPMVYLVMLIASLAAVGFPGFSGFYSKDLILSAIQNAATAQAKIIYYLLLGNSFVTALYIFRLFFLIFHGPAKHAQVAVTSSLLITLPLIILAILSLAIGWVGIGYLSVEPSAGSMMLHGFIAVPFLLTVLAVGVAWFCYIQQPWVSALGQDVFAPVYMVLVKRYWFNEINNGIVMTIKLISRGLLQVGDKFIIERLLVNGTVKWVHTVSRKLGRMQTGYLYHYILVMMTGLVLLLYFLCLGGSGYF